jgi:hypothetical protein
MSCVGGLGFWYMQDPTLGGILGPAASSAVSTPSDSTLTSTSTADPPAGKVDTSKEYYIYSKSCANGGYTVLSGFTGSPSRVDAKDSVNMGCETAQEHSSKKNGWKTYWKFESAGGGLYYVRLSGTTPALYLTGVKDKHVQLSKLNKANAWQKWYVGSPSSGNLTLSLSASALGSDLETGKEKPQRFLATDCGYGEPFRLADDDEPLTRKTWGLRVKNSSSPDMKRKC